MDINKLRVRVKRDEHGPATEALSREGLDRLVDDAIYTLTTLNSEVTPDSIREYVEVNVRINVFIGRYFAPSTSEMEDVLDRARLEGFCAHHDGAEELDAQTPNFR
ncbi:hypothetical protein [uncultured Aureimonas sp.]|uniref:hypothetical protein n=1 Tax=uncultured Aureimonas sp. TaxID=1604662 RepID=UPI0025E1D0A8|nr:hypothetical protein [uncultured Aureimonas sp.]